MRLCLLLLLFASLFVRGSARCSMASGSAADASKTSDAFETRSWASTEKESSPDGTWEEPAVAFQAFLDKRPPIFGSYGFHSTPHVGVYGEDYTPTLPIGLISVPVKSAADGFKQFPDSVAAVLRKCVELRLLEVERLETYVMIHSGLTLRECGHLRCDNRDEFNIMYHAWVFANDGVSNGRDEIFASLHMGLFEAHGVRPVHLEFAEGGGIAFDRLSLRSVLLHDRRFSPNNANVRLDGSTDTPIFFTVAVDRVLRSGVVVLHIQPIGDGPSDRIREWIRGKRTLLELLTAMREHLPVAAGYMERLLAAVD